MIDITKINPQWVKFKKKKNQYQEILNKYSDKEDEEDKWEEGELYALVDAMYPSEHKYINQTCYLIKSADTNELKTYPCQDYLVEFGFNAK